MRRLLCFAAIAVILPAAANAATWIGICNDGKNIQYNQTVGGPGLLYMKTTGGTMPPSGGTQMATLTQTSFDGDSICGTVTGNPSSLGGVPLSQLCIAIDCISVPGPLTAAPRKVCRDRTVGSLIVKWQSPYPGNTLKWGTYCRAKIMVN